MNYTKGEWKIEPYLDNSPISIKKPSGDLVAVVSRSTYGEALANAHLIAAAPEMYEATTIALDLVKAVLYEHPDDAIAILQKHLIDKALAKAEGREDGH